MAPQYQISKKNRHFDLNSAQKAAAEAPISPLLIVAGAGTGKTKTLTSRIVHLIETGVRPERICAITFTNKAAKEMADRVVAVSKSGGGQGPYIGTFHSLGARILRRECGTLDRKPNFAIFDDHDSFDLLKKIVKAAGIANKKQTPAFFASMISKMKNMDSALEDARISSDERALAQTIFDRYEAALARNNAFDFDDLIEKPVAIFRRHPAVLQKYQALFDALLVDEYQDINPKQYELVKFLARGHRNLSVVGDDEQTIYSWRHADVKTFLGFDKEWPGAAVHFLEENYRSTGTIIRAAAAVVANNSFRTPKKLWTARGDGEAITLFEAWGENDEAEWVAGEIKKMLGAEARADEPAKAAVLYRTNAQSRAVEQALIRNDIAYQIFGGLRFYERREVKDAMAAVRWASNDRDEVAKERLEKNLSKKNFAAFRENVLAAKARAGADPAPLAVLKVFLETFGYFDYLEENFVNAGEREENVAELIAFASGFNNLPEFLEKVSLLQATDDEHHQVKTAQTREVSLMTIHMAKGLEFDAVFIVGAAEGLLPHIRSIGDEASVEEERRLMYVAMTRAKKKLHLSFSGMPSRFIAEIPEDCIGLANAGTDADLGAGSGERDEDEEVVRLD